METLISPANHAFSKRGGRLSFVVHDFMKFSPSLWVKEMGILPFGKKGWGFDEHYDEK